MKKIENIIDNCIDCPSCGLYKRTREQEWGQIAVCHEYDRVLFMASETAPLNDLSIPDWCPLETYNEVEKSEVQLDALAVHRSTLILPDLPNLEWMTENLTGHGGTEVDGRWYYTYDQAVAAVKALGNGWRLPTDEEFEKLADVESTWVNDGPGGQSGRWFGGNRDTDHEGSLFFPASGVRYRTDGSLSSVGSNGYYWSSSPASAGSQNAGYLYFFASSVYPFDSNARAFGFTVRCVREIKTLSK